jgi:maleylacetoacetate isomerase
MEWGKCWIDFGLNAFEKEVNKYCGLYCVGDEISIADLCLIPQLYNARR